MQGNQAIYGVGGGITWTVNGKVNTRKPSKSLLFSTVKSLALSF